MRIRPVVAQDKEKILGLLEQRGTFTPNEIQLAMAVLEEALGYPERQDYYIFCGLDREDALTGYICFGPIPITDGCYDIYWIVVDERSGRQGIAGRLFDFMEEFVKKEHARRIYIDTSSTSAYVPARSFYKKHGFEPACVLTDFYRKGDDKIIFLKEVGNSV